jgi:hypothetical protein
VSNNRARLAKFRVLVLKLERLSRDVAFVAGLMAQRVPFTARAAATERNTLYRLEGPAHTS